MMALFTGFGPFGKVQYNPSSDLAETLAERIPDSAAHVFKTSYSAVDMELPEVLERHRPRWVLMFGLAPRADRVRIERLARNTLAAHTPDIENRVAQGVINPNGDDLKSTLPIEALLSAFQMEGIQATASDNAGGYVCNYAFYRMQELADDSSASVRHSGFIHIPPAGRYKRVHGRPLSIEAIAKGIALLLRGH